MHPSTRSAIPRVQSLSEKAFQRLLRFSEIEAFSGAILLAAAAIALLWANSPWAASYAALWHTPVGFSLGEWHYTQSLHFWLNDGLMTLFFLVVGMEVRHEMHSGSLRNVRQALLPMAAAVGGVLVPALIYVAFNAEAVRHHGWAVPTATDIAFAVGILALLGNRVPGNVRIFLLTLAIIDDIAAVLLIAFFYSKGLALEGLWIALGGVAIVLLLQRMGVWRAWAYILPGAIVWVGLLKTGAHPTLAGVILGLLTPVVPVQREVPAKARLEQVLDHTESSKSLRELAKVQRELLPPVVRVQGILHPWVAFLIMPLFALANAGVSLAGVDLAYQNSLWISVGVAAALVLGKPIGVVGVSWLLVKSKLCQLPENVSWGGICLIGLLAGIGFTMSIFIAMLAFNDVHFLNAAKLGVLLGSVLAAMLGLGFGAWYFRKRT